MVTSINCLEEANSQKKKKKGVATEWEQPLFVCGVYQVDIDQRAGVKKVLWTFDS